jgi:hypothetical protein
MIHRYLEETGGAYTIDEDGDYIVEYDRDPDSGADLTVYLSILEGETYSIQVVDEREFPKADWDRLIRLCNTWNSHERYPMAYLLVDEDSPNKADVLLEHCTFLKTGATQQQLSDLTEEIIESAFDFWEWAHSEHGL